MNTFTPRTTMQSIAIVVVYTHFVGLTTCIRAQENARKLVTHSNVLFNNLNDERLSDASLNTQSKVSVDYQRRNATQFHAPASTNIVSKATPNTNHQSQPTYGTDQYIDYYWQSPPAYKLQTDVATSTTSHVNNGSDTELSSTNETAVNIAPTILIGLTSVQRTVFVVIERIRSMWDYVWSYFSEPGPALTQLITRSLGVFESTGRSDDAVETRHTNHLHKKRVRHRFRKFLIPLLMAYKLKFFTLIPMIISGLVLLTGSAGMSGFFFALFTAVLSMKHKPV